MLRNTCVITIVSVFNVFNFKYINELYKIEKINFMAK